MARFDLKIFADYRQFYIQDDDVRYGDLSESWTEEAVANFLAVSDHVVGIGTARNTDVPVSVESCAKLPELNPGEWDLVNAATLECGTGRLVVAGCTDYFPDAFRLELSPGIYEVLIGYRGMESVSSDGLSGNDSYHIFIAPKNV